MRGYRVIVVNQKKWISVEVPTYEKCEIDEKGIAEMIDGYLEKCTIGDAIHQYRIIKLKRNEEETREEKIKDFLSNKEDIKDFFI